MATLVLFLKDVREHRVAALFLGVGCVVIMLILLAQNRAAAYSMSSFEIVRFSLLSVVPLVALIVGNRLIVKEYQSGTRLFVEALPVGQNLPLVLKYFIGFVFLALLAVAVVLLAASSASIADEVTIAYLALILGKTLVMVWLYWSIVFCFSICGYLRIALYLLLGALIIFLAHYPGIDSDLLPPFALMDDQLFVFERDLIPWKDILGTAVLSIFFTLGGFLLIRVGEGSVVERLAKPMARRDYVALGVLSATGLAVWSAMIERNDRPSVEFTSDYVVRLAESPVSVLYLDADSRQSAETLANRLTDSLTALQATLALSKLPQVRVALAPGRKAHDIDYDTSNGVYIKANWLNHDSYDNAIMDTVILHGVLNSQTGERAVFEPYHWVLDGFTRWWVEQGDHELDDSHSAELLARALWVLDMDPSAIDLIGRWQLIADRFAYPSAEALAWSVMTFLEQLQGRESVLALALEFLTQPVGSTVLASIKDRRVSVESRLQEVLGMPAEEFFSQWYSWLMSQRTTDTVARQLEYIPPLQGEISSGVDESGVSHIRASYQLTDAAASQLPYNMEQLLGLCVMKHEYIGPFDTEFDVVDDYEDVTPCRIGAITHDIESVYAAGDRLFVALDYEGGQFHQPLRLHAERLTVK